MQSAIFTIVSNNYLHYARTLFQGVAAHHPECARFCVIVDRDLTEAGRFSNEFSSIPLEDLGLPHPDRFMFGYSILESNTAVKPWVFERLFERGFRDVVYLDPDIALYGPMQEAFGLLATTADIVVTPHLLAPIDDDREPSELTIRRSGTYNFGFCALSRSANTAAFLRWWKQKLLHNCVVDMERGIFVDQSWIDLVPGLFPRVAILRHAGYNVAYWNLAQRRVREVDSRWTANDERLVFFHFSGFDVDAPANFSKHQNRFDFSNMGEEKRLVVDYAATLLANGALRLKASPYGFSTFLDGRTTIPDCFRKVYREDAHLQERMGANPFDHPEILIAQVESPDASAPPITYAMYALWKTRSDLGESFPLTDGDSLRRFFKWFVSEGRCYFSEDVVAAHARMLEEFDAAPGAWSRGIPPIVRSRLIHRLYIAVLRRSPDEAGMRTYGRVRLSRLGAFRIYLALVLSRESRAQRGWWRRALRGAGTLAGAFRSR